MELTSIKYYFRVRLSFLWAIALLVGCSSPSAREDVTKQEMSGMVLIPAGEFIMGTDDEESYDHERPAHRVKVKTFWIDETEVTNKQFDEFVQATGYVTVAERKPSWEDLKVQLPPGTPPPPDSILVPGSLVFFQPEHPVTLNDYSQWWKWEKGANWKHPEGVGSTLEGKWNHPVVHMAYEDAAAYCDWAKKRLPTEAEWEYASQGKNQKQQRYSWGSELAPNGKLMANTFQGSFPMRNLKEDGFETTSPVKSFPPNDFGLYDMIGNVWEWTSDWYDVNYFQTLSRNALSDNPKGPDKPNDPLEPYSRKRVTKGGSFLCASNYCTNYRPTARQGTSFDSGQSHLGFRCVRDAE